MNSLPLWASIPASILLVASGIATLTGSAGLLRFKDFYSRIHAPTMGNTLGAIGVLAASVLISSAAAQRLVLHEILILILLFVTPPITTILLMQAAIHRDGRRTGGPDEQPPLDP